MMKVIYRLWWSKRHKWSEMFKLYYSKNLKFFAGVGDAGQDEALPDALRRGRHRDAGGRARPRHPRPLHVQGIRR